MYGVIEQVCLLRIMLQSLQHEPDVYLSYSCGSHHPLHWLHEWIHTCTQLYLGTASTLPASTSEHVNRDYLRLCSRIQVFNEYGS